MQKTGKKKPKIKRFPGLRMDMISTARGVRATFGGIKAVSSLSEEDIAIEAKMGAFLIAGERLEVTVLEGGVAEIEGNIEKIEIVYRKGVFRDKN